MAWNKPSEAKVEAKGRGGQSKVYLKGILAGAVAVVVGVVCIFAFSGKSEKPVKDTGTKPAKIKEVTPAKAQTNTVQAVKKPTKRLPDFLDAPTPEGLTPVQTRMWKHHHNPPSWTNTTSLTTPKSAYEIFPSPIENQIARLMTLQPGETLVGTPVYDSKKIQREFIKSCETPIVISDEDTPYQRQLKEDMVQMKIELRDRMADGEDLAKILADTRKENQRLAAIKRSVESDLRKMIESEAVSEGDVDDFVAAANKILDQKGIAPIKANPLTKRAFMRAIKSNAKKAASAHE